MAIVVQKYGGSSVADLEKLSKVADWVVATKRAGHSVVVVVSAMGKTTDELLSLAQRAAETGGGGNSPPRRELDMLLSVGERTSMALLSIAVQARGEPAVSLTGSQSGIITNDRHFDARIIEVRPHRIEDELYHGKIVIVAGYQGMSYRREITTLGRGGSDTTAVALSAALSAERCEIYSDVDGVYSADPRSVPDARHLPELDFATMQEMAESGAKVLHARAVEWAKRQNIAILARKTEDYATRGEGLQTRVHASSGTQARAVVVDRHLALLSCPARALASLFAAAEASELLLRDGVYVDGALRATLALSAVPSAAATLRSLAERVPGLEITTGVGSVSWVGVGAGAEPLELARFAQSVGERPLLTFTSPLRATAILPQSELGAAEAALHAQL
ncbi:MAG: aspartate kinase [Polyangiaceae bacterium]|jgi:aspartate kinase|nr:aspartate kinase [Polyangiaceae bacterium]